MMTTSGAKAAVIGHTTHVDVEPSCQAVAHLVKRACPWVPLRRPVSAQVWGAAKRMPQKLMQAKNPTRALRSTICSHQLLADLCREM
eukprot:scaffold32690_cov107-Isochrysis_galbana.AAC.7